MSIDRLLSQYGSPVNSWPGEEDLDEEAKANLAASTRKLPTEGGATDAGSLLPITRYPPRVGTDPATWKSAGDVLASLDDGWRLEPFNRISAPFKSMLDGLRTQPLLGPMVRPSQMQPEVLEQMTGDAMSVAGAGLMGNVPRVLSGAPAGAIDFGIFGGRRGAETLAAKGEPRPLQALDMVEAMEKAGKSRDEIWQATSELLKDTPYAGAFRGVDQKPRFEIDDSGAKYTPDTPVSRVPEMVQHDPLFAAYPALMDIAAKREKALDFRGERGVNGYFDPERNVVAIHDDLGRKSGKSTALHELTHAGPQEAEGFARGYNPSAAAEEIGQARLREQELREKTERWKNGHTDAARLHMARAANGDPDSLAFVSEARSRWEGQFGAKSDENPFGVTPQEAVAFQLMEQDDVLSRALKEYNDVLKVARLDPYDLYKMYAGETEARTVQKRMDLSPEERRARPPWMDYDVPEKDQIVRFGGDGKAASIDPDAPHPIDKLLDEVAPPASAPVTVPTSLDTLGYYSPLIESARSLKQAKGTPEQMLAQLKKAGVRDAEIEATGLGALLDGKKSVTRDEIVKHLEENKVGLREVVRSRGQPKFPYTTERQWDDAMQLALERGQTERYEDLSAARGDWRDGRFDDPGDTKWADYSLDPSNPTYRETVLHLPVRDRDEYAQSRWGKSYDELTSDQKQFVDAEKAAFQSVHFPEPNIVGHMMTSMTTHEGKPVYTIDQIQSDWGQKLRDGGVRDEAKIAELKQRLEELAPNKKALDDANAFLRDVGNVSIHTDVSVGDAPRLLRNLEQVKSRLRKDSDDRWITAKALEKQMAVEVELSNRRGLLEAELRTAEASTPGNPLVNTTDQWVNTVLRRAVRQAAEADADYIAIPSGRTVESYNPQGSSEGVDVFYDKIVPKNLRNLLQKIDKSVPAPQRIETLDSPSGKTGLGQGFTLFPLTPAIKRQVLEGGQPLFKSGGAVTSVPPCVPDFTPAMRALQAAVPRRGARDANEILDLYSKD